MDLPDIEEFARLMGADADEYKAQMSAIRSGYALTGSLDTFNAWKKEVVKEARVIAHRDAVEAVDVPVGQGTDVCVSDALINMLSEGITRPVLANGYWYVYGGDGVYVPWNEDRVISKLTTLDGTPFFNEKGQPALLNMSASKVKNVLFLAKARLAGGYGRGQEFFEDRPPGIMFVNTFLTIGPDGEVMAERINPYQRATRRHDFCYDPDIRAPKFLKYMSEMLTAEQIPAMQEFLGATLFGLATMYQRSAFLKGSPGTGKSTLVRLMRGIMPPGSTCTVEPSDWGKAQHLASMAGKLFNGIEELCNAHLGDINVMKSVISGDTMAAKEVYKPVFHFSPRASHMIASNEWPQTSNSDRAFWERWIVFNLKGRRYRGKKGQIRDFEKTLISSELPGIIAWVVEGMRRLASQGYYTSIGDQAASLWREESNNVAVFLKESLTVTDHRDSTTKKRVYEVYRNWCGEAGCHALGRNKFYAALMREPGIIQCGHMSGSFSVTIGVTLKLVQGG